MAGTKLGGAKARETNIAKFGPHYYTRIGYLGGKVGGSGKGFGAGDAGRERARLAGQKGGSISRRTKPE